MSIELPSLGENPDESTRDYCAEEIPENNWLSGNGPTIEVDADVLAELLAPLDVSGGMLPPKVLELVRKIYNDADEVFRRNVDDFRRGLSDGPDEPDEPSRDDRDR